MREVELQPSDLAYVRFFGAAREVTGSCTLLRTHRSRVLIDCGLFQGPRPRRRLNAEPFPFDVAALDAVVLTHAHIDHSGLLPRLVDAGFNGDVHVTSGTRDLCQILLLDAAHIQEQHAERQNRRRLRRGDDPIDPLYTTADAERALQSMVSHPFDERIAIAPGVTVRFQSAGHIVGAASIEVWVEDGSISRKLVFSGDLGRRDASLLRPPTSIADADLVMVESTYGDRDHRNLKDTDLEFEEVMSAAEKAREKVIIPVFAVGRAQEVLHSLKTLEDSGRLRPRPVYLDSPMAIRVTELCANHAGAFRKSLEEAFSRGADPLHPRRLVLSRDWQDSMQINWEHDATVLAGSGMCDGGRVVHHLKHGLWRKGTHVVIVGFQAQGTPGRALVDGARMLRIFGEEIVVKAKIHTLGGFSAHADQSGLLAWLDHFKASRPRLVLVHGEPEKQDALAEVVESRFGSPPLVPERGDWITLPVRGGGPQLFTARLRLAKK